jgi:hypothetical protein
MSGVHTQLDVDLGTSVKVESPVLQASLWVGPTLTVLPLLAWMALEIFQLLGRAPLLKPSSDRIATAFEVVATARKFERVLTETERVQLSYRVSARPGYLDLYREGAREASALLARLRSLTADDIQQTALAPGGSSGCFSDGGDFFHRTCLPQPASRRPRAPRCRAAAELKLRYPTGRGARKSA